jgi:hypothetical protein
MQSSRWLCQMARAPLSALRARTAIKRTRKPAGGFGLDPASPQAEPLCGTILMYDPADGNLLLDVTIPSGATVSGQGFGFLTFDTVNTIDDGIYSVVNIGDGGAASGTLSTADAITAFSVSSAAVPEPSTWLMVITGFGILGAAMWRRRSAFADPKNRLIDRVENVGGAVKRVAQASIMARLERLAIAFDALKSQSVL